MAPFEHLAGKTSDAGAFEKSWTCSPSLAFGGREPQREASISRRLRLDPEQAYEVRFVIEYALQRGRTTVTSLLSLSVGDQDTDHIELLAAGILYLAKLGVHKARLYRHIS